MLGITKLIRNRKFINLYNRAEPDRDDNIKESETPIEKPKKNKR
jgi:hypothetical protein